MSEFDTPAEASYEASLHELQSFTKRDLTSLQNSDELASSLSGVEKDMVAVTKHIIENQRINPTGYVAPFPLDPEFPELVGVLPDHSGWEEEIKALEKTEGVTISSDTKLRYLVNWYEEKDIAEVNIELSVEDTSAPIYMLILGKNGDVYSGKGYTSMDEKDYYPFEEPQNPISQQEYAKIAQRGAQFLLSLTEK